MKRNNRIPVSQRPILGTPHGPLSVQGWDWVQAHEALVQTLVLILGGLVVALVLSHS